MPGGRTSVSQNCYREDRVLRSWVRGLVCVLTAVAGCIPACAASDDQLQELIQRLEAAEARIHELEQQVQQQQEAPAQDSDDSVPAVKPATWSDSSRPTDPTVEPKWNSQESWEELMKNNAQLSSRIDKSVQSGSKGTRSMKVKGRIHSDYWSFPRTDSGINQLETLDPNSTPQDRLGFRRLRFGVEGDLNPNTGYKIEMEFAGGDESEFRDAWIAMKDVKHFQTVTIGNHKRPYGLDHLNSSRHNVFLERPFVIESFNQDARRLGISSKGHTEDLSWNWLYGVWNQRLIQDEGNYISDHLQGQIAGRLANTWWYDERSGGRGYAHSAVSATVAHPDGSTLLDPVVPGRTEARNEAQFNHRPEARSASRWLDTGRIIGADWYELIGLEQVINVGPLQIVGEYQNVFLQRDSGFRDVHLHGGYVYVSYFLTGEHMPWNRKSGTLDRVVPFENFFLVDRCCGGTGTGWGAWQVAVRYSYADFNDGDGDPTITSQEVFGGIGEAVTIGLNWVWNPNTRLQFNYLNGSISDRNLLGTLVGGDYEIFGARLLVDF